MGNGEWKMENGKWENKKNLKIGKNMKYLYFINK